MEKRRWIVSLNETAVVEDCDEWKIVAAVYGYNANTEDDAPGVAERSHLIAAAPELLEALKEMRDALHIIVSVTSMDHIAELDIAVRADLLADAAIAKAEQKP